MSFDAVGIISNNIDRTKTFYKLLGIELKQVGGPGHLESSTPSGIRIMVDSVELIKKINPNWIESKGNGIVLCFVQESPARVDELVSAFSESGFKIIKKPWDAFWGQRYSSVEDPDGNQIDIFATL
ncbi:MAG: putative glyoxalase superfamily protein PhnB [Bacteriovoracaceae bacterium]|jgi:uncharacterized glyoxalase superfamily protein PhnB